MEVVSLRRSIATAASSWSEYRRFGVAEYWIVDPEACTIEVWDLASSVEVPTLFHAADTLRWAPAGEATTLAVPLIEVFGGSRL